MSPVAILHGLEPDSLDARRTPEREVIPVMPDHADLTPEQREIKSRVLAERRQARKGLPYHQWYAHRHGDARAVRDALALSTTLRQVAQQCAACRRQGTTIAFVGNAVALLCGRHLCQLRLAESLDRVPEFVAFVNERQSEVVR